MVEKNFFFLFLFLVWNSFLKVKEESRVEEELPLSNEDFSKQSGFEDDRTICFFFQDFFFTIYFLF